MIKNIINEIFPRTMYGTPYTTFNNITPDDTLVFDLGGVLVRHNMPGCIAAFTALMGEENMHLVLGLASNGEGVADSLMDEYECGNVTTKQFVAQILKYCKSGTTEEDVKKAWITMHGGMMNEEWQIVKSLHSQGFRTFLLSNNNEMHWQHALSQIDGHINDYFDDVFLSHLMHCRKPDKKIFETVNAAIGSKPQNTVFIDDIEENRQAATNAVGWRTLTSVKQLRF